jgi:hypothetical protein
MTKFIKTLIIINGLVIPIAVLIVFIILIVQFIQNSSRRYIPEVVNTTNTITKDGDTLLLQGLRYEDPKPIYNSMNFTIGVMPRTYERPRKISGSVNFEGGYSSMEFPSENYVNILFLDSNYNVIRRLLDKKASIESVTIPTRPSDEMVDTTVKNIGYLIAFSDSNNDKKIDWNDKYDLYISDLEGKDLFQVTKDIDVLEYKFINNHHDIFISYNDRSELRDEYKIRRFALFGIKTRQFKTLSSIDKALNEIQNILK